VIAAGLALLAIGARWAAAPGGLLLGFALYLSYGFVLVGLLALTVVAARARDRLWVLTVATGTVAVVVATFTVAGFWWLDGYHLVVQRYYQGWAAERPYGYWVWGNLAAVTLSAGPVVGPALRRAVAAGRSRAVGAGRSRAVGAGRSRAVGAGRSHAVGAGRTGVPRPPATGPTRRAVAGFRRRMAGPGRPAGWLSLAAAVTVLAADLSGLSKAEVERIWLPFAVWLLVATAHLPARDRRWWLAAQAGTALAVNHLLWTVS